ncbi:MAG: NAD(P)H-dependent glycerol-3-phosphate dehydrogenase [Nanobdellota archaeon]
MEKITIIGAGAFGFAFAKLISDNNPQKSFTLYDVDSSSIKHISEKRTHPYFHGNVSLGENVRASNDISEAEDAGLIVIAVPSRHLRRALEGLKGHVSKDAVFLSLVKGLEPETDMRASAIIRQVIGKEHHICSLSGGMIAREVTRGNPLCADLASENREVAKEVARMLHNDRFRLETTSDLKGVELAGAFKNVIAIGAGVFDGRENGESSKSAFVSAAAREVKRLAVHLGAKPFTYDPGSQSWFGDLMTSCFGASRNRRFGELIGSGLSVEEAYDKLKQEKKSVEGYQTAGVVYRLANDIDTPILDMIYSLLFSDYDPEDFVTDFIRSW